MAEMDRIAELMRYIDRLHPEVGSYQSMKVSLSSCLSCLMCCKRDNGYNKVEISDMVEPLSPHELGGMRPLLKALQEYQGMLCKMDTLAGSGGLVESDSSHVKARELDLALQYFLSDSHEPGSMTTIILDDDARTRQQQVLAMRTLISDNVEACLCDDRGCLPSLFYSSSKYINKLSVDAEDSFIDGCKKGLIPEINATKTLCEQERYGDEMFELS